MLRGRRGEWTVAGEDRTLNEVRDLPMVGILGSPDVPSVLRVHQKSEASLANLLALTPGKANIESIGDNDSRVQTVKLTQDRHIVWRIPVRTLQKFEQSLPHDASVVRVTHGLPPVVRTVLEANEDAQHPPDAVLCGDQRNFVWIDFNHGVPSEGIRPREISTDDELIDFVESICAERGADGPINIHVHVSPFCWLRALPPALSSRLGPNVKVELNTVGISDIIFA
jgi:hypothetical protein